MNEAERTIEAVLEEYEAFLKKNPEANQQNHLKQSRIIGKGYLAEINLPPLIIKYTFGGEVLNKETMKFIKDNNIWMAGMMGSIPPRILGVSKKTRLVYDLIEKEQDQELSSKLNITLGGDDIRQFIQHQQLPEYDLSFLTTGYRIINFEEELHKVPEHTFYRDAWHNNGTFYIRELGGRVLNVNTKEFVDEKPRNQWSTWEELYTPAGSIEFGLNLHMHKHENPYKYYKAMEVETHEGA